MSENEVEQTDQSALDAADAERIAQQVAPPPSQKPSALMWFGLSALMVVALLVIFVLPSLVTEYELPLERRVEVANAPAVVAEPEATISPFEEAQRSIQRKEAQDILAELLERQTELDELEVEQWGQESYNAALEEASIGDEYYRTQDFILASQYYTRGRDALGELLATKPNVLQQLLIDGENALNAADSALAQEKFSLALVLESANETAQVGLERAQALDEVLQLVQQADELFEDDELEAARDIYQQIIELDSYNETAPARIAEIEQQLIQREFGRIMSEGYAHLENGDPEQAIATFERAANLGINQQEAQAAIVQTQNQVANVRINALRETIMAAEAAERWQEAVTAYDDVLAIDANLTFAIDGRDYADKRARLDSLLVNALNNPERFSEDAVYQQTLDVYYTGRNIENPGPVLVSQLDELEVLLENSQIPIDIRLASDNLTDVTVQRVGNLGKFEQEALSLKPGRYVAIGRRVGYRDVREEFTVGFGLTPELVVVRCEERVIATGGQ